MFAYVGSLTGDPSSTGEAVSLSVVRVDPASGSLTCVQSMTGLHSPTYVGLHPNGVFLFAGERDFPPMGAESPGTGAITTLAIDPDSGSLRLVSRRPSGGPVHVTVHPSGQFIFVPMNRARQVGVFPVQADGSVGEPTCVVQHEGRGPKSPIQNQAFPHSSFLDIGARRLLCCDLGMDRVMVYDFDAATGQLQPSGQPFAQVSSGSGPRHLALHPSNRFVYVLSELASTISVFAYDPDAPTFSIVQTISALPDDFAGPSAAAQILVHPSGGFVYASNRGHDSVAMFSVDQETGKLRTLGHEPSLGERPHNFTIDRAGQLMLVANQRSNEIVSFRIDARSGLLEATGHMVSVPAPVCMVINDP